MDGDEIRRGVGEGQGVDVAMAHLGVADVGLLEVEAGDGQHLAARIDADGLSGVTGKDLEHGAGAGAEIDMELDGRTARQPQHGGFHILLAHMQRAEAFPIAGVFAEVGCGCLGALVANFFEAGEVAGQFGVMAGQQVDDGAGEGAAQIILAHAEQHPVAFLVAGDQPGLGHQLEMAADARLALPEDLGHLADVEFAMGEHEQDAYPCRFRRRPQSRQQFFHCSPFR